jgi:hypothetical protein
MLFLVSTPSGPDRAADLQEFYREMDSLREATGGPFYLSDATAEYDWPERGIYFFFSRDVDPETDPVSEWPIRRVGTVGVSEGSESTLWERLRAHRGTLNSRYGEKGGNHRGSIFRKWLGMARIHRDELYEEYPYWGVPHRNLPEEADTQSIREQEHEIEQQVSEHIRDMPFLVLGVNDDPGPTSDRAKIEKNLIALISHTRRSNASVKQDSWVGQNVPRAEIWKTGLWNIEHVSGFYRSSILSDVAEYRKQMSEISPD